MKYLSILPLAALLAMGLASGAQAGFLPSELDPGASYGITAEHPHHVCHGALSGTADPACGTLSGGPSGGLF